VLTVGFVTAERGASAAVMTVREGFCIIAIERDFLSNYLDERRS
jgi:hypothetical protein